MILSGRAKAARAVVFGALLLSVAACSPVFRNHGYAPTDAELSQVNIGATREQVAQAVGRPTTMGLLNDQGWFYVQSRFRHFGARAPREIEREVVAISFTPQGTVSNVERFGLEQGRIVPLSRRVTDADFQGNTFLRQLFGSVGRLRADQILED